MEGGGKKVHKLVHRNSDIKARFSNWSTYIEQLTLRGFGDFSYKYFIYIVEVI